MVGHIEDISVAKDQQGKRLGLRIIEALDHIAREVGCYKVYYIFSEYNLHQLSRAGASIILLEPLLCVRTGLTRHFSQSILDCSEANEGFYVKCGYKRAGLEMSHYYEGSK